MGTPALPDSEWENFLECCSTEELSSFLDKLKGSNGAPFAAPGASFKPGSLEASIMALQNGTGGGGAHPGHSGPLGMDGAASSLIAHHQLAAPRPAFDSRSLAARQVGMMERIMGGSASADVASTGEVTTSFGESSFMESAGDATAKSDATAAADSPLSSALRFPHQRLFGSSPLGPSKLGKGPAAATEPCRVVGRAKDDASAGAEERDAGEAVVQVARSGGGGGGGSDQPGGENSPQRDGSSGDDDDFDGSGGEGGKGRRASRDRSGLGVRSEGRQIKLKSHVESQRRKRISEGLKRLRDAVKGTGDTATMLDEAVAYVDSLKQQVSSLQVSLLLKDTAPRNSLGAASPGLNLDSPFLIQAALQQQQQMQQQHQHASTAASLGMISAGAIPSGFGHAQQHQSLADLSQDLLRAREYPSLARYGSGGGGSPAHSAGGAAAPSLLPRAGWSKRLVETSTGGSSSSGRFGR